MIEDETFYGVPFTVVLYRDEQGNTIPQDFLSELDPPPKGFRLVELNDKAKERVSGMVELRRIVNELIEYQLEDYAEYRQVKKDMQEYLIAKQTVEHILGIDRKNRIITQQQNLD